MRFEITDQDLEDEMTSSYGHKRYRIFQRNYLIPNAVRNLNLIFQSLGYGAKRNSKFYGLIPV
jgi:hypothetical protein